MSADDLVSGLLAKLEQEEQRARSMGHDNPDEGGYYACPATRSDPYGDLPWGEDACECRLAERRESVLRLCQAHRDIIEIYKRQYELEAAGAGQSTGTQGVLVYAVALLEDVVESLARGLGVEETTDE